MATIWIDGEWHTRETARVSVFDHGLLYGDGVFEGIRAYSGRIFKLAEHLDRLGYVGDDRGDLAAFAAVHEQGGVCVAVDHGDETPPELLDAADAAVVGTEGVAALLRTLHTALPR